MINLLCDADNILDNYSDKVWWRCKDCNHKYQMSPKQRGYYQKRHMKSCPHCKGLRQKKKTFLLKRKATYLSFKIGGLVVTKCITENLRNKVHKFIVLIRLFFPQLHHISSTTAAAVFNRCIVLLCCIDILMA